MRTLISLATLILAAVLIVFFLRLSARVEYLESRPQGGSLSELPLLKDYEAARISSADKSGSNYDRISLGPLEEATLAEIDIAGVISHLWFTVREPEGYQQKLVLRMWWDGEPEPSVEVPIGDFFCTGHGLARNITSLPISVSSEGRSKNTFFQMPFESAQMTVTNESE